MQAAPGRPTTALVFAGGGSFGAIQVGMLKALAAHGLQADMVLGSSVGAINAAHYAADPTPAGIAKLESLWRAARRKDVFPLTLSSVVRFALRRDHLVDPASLRRLVADNLPIRRVEDTPVPLRIIATDVLTGEACVIGEGDAVEAILASTAVPVAFPTVDIGTRHLVDAALSSNTPVRIAVSLGATRIVVLPTGFSCALARPPRDAIAKALHSLTLLIASQLVREIESLDASIDFTIVPPLCPLEGSPYDFSNSADLIDRSYRMTEAWIGSGGLERRVIPGALRAHHH